MEELELKEQHSGEKTCGNCKYYMQHYRTKASSTRVFPSEFLKKSSIF